jgi:uncharacterized protein (UPF0548 family)
MAEPTLSVNIVMDAASEYHNDVRKYGKAEAWKRNGKRIGKAFMIYLCTQTAAALVESFADALRDDDDEEFWKKYLEALLGEDNAKRILGEELGKNAKGVLMSAYADGNLLQDYLFLNKLPFIKDLASLLTGFKSRNMMTEGAENLLNVYKIWRETKQLADGVLGKPTSITYYGKMTPWGRIYKTLQAVSQLSGTPLYGLSRDVVAIWNTIMNGRKDEWKIRTYDNRKSTDKLLQALRAGEDTGDARAALIGNGMDQKDIDSAVRSEIKAMFFGTEKKKGISEEEALRLLMEEGGMRERDAEKQIQEWKYQKENDAVYDKMREDYLNGDISREEAVRARVEYGGVSEADAEKTVREWDCEKDTGIKYDEIQAAYVDGDVTREEAVEMRVKYGLADRRDAEALVQKWDCEKETGIRYDDLDDAYLSGDISKEQAVKYRVTYGGQSQKNAEQTVREWDCEKETGVKYSDMQDAYLNGDITREQAVKNRVTYGGQSQREAEQSVREWDCEKDTGIKYSDLQSAYLDGDVSRKQAVEMRVKYGQAKQEDAEALVKKWDCEKETGIPYDEIRDRFVSGSLPEKKAIEMMVKYGGKDEIAAQKTMYRYRFVGTDKNLDGITDSAATHYYAEFYETNMSKQTYYNAWMDLKAFGADYDAKGDSIPYSKMNKIMAYINELPVTKEQKDLFFLMYYSEKQLKKTPWH